MDDPVSAVAHAIREARRLLFITGAGISADSGLPTYRGIGGLYTDAETTEGMPIEELLSGAHFRRRPDVTWKYLHQLERASRGAAHNAAHRFIAGRAASHDVVTVLTQNVDGFHRDAGSSDGIDLHGDIKALVCTLCDWSRRVDDFGALERGFHEALGRAAKNLYLQEAVPRIFNLHLRLWFYISSKSTSWHPVAHSHDEMTQGVVDAIRERSPEKAEEVMTSYIAQRHQEVKSLL